MNWRFVCTLEADTSHSLRVTSAKLRLHLRAEMSTSDCPSIEQGSASQEINSFQKQTISCTLLALEATYIEPWALLSILKRPVWAVFYFLVNGANWGCTGLRLLVIITTNSVFCGAQGRCWPSPCLCHMTVSNLILPHQRNSYISLICAGASAGLVSTAGSGSRGRGGGFVSWDVPPAPSSKTKSLSSQFHNSRRNHYSHC